MNVWVKWFIIIIIIILQLQIVQLIAKNFFKHGNAELYYVHRCIFYVINWSNRHNFKNGTRPPPRYVHAHDSKPRRCKFESGEPFPARPRRNVRNLQYVPKTLAKVRKGIARRASSSSSGHSSSSSWGARSAAARSCSQAPAGPGAGEGAAAASASAAVRAWWLGARRARTATPASEPAPAAASRPSLGSTYTCAHVHRPVSTSAPARRRRSGAGYSRIGRRGSAARRARRRRRRAARCSRAGSRASPRLAPCGTGRSSRARLAGLVGGVESRNVRRGARAPYITRLGSRWRAAPLQPSVRRLVISRNCKVVTVLGNVLGHLYFPLNVQEGFSRIVDKFSTCLLLLSYFNVGLVLIFSYIVKDVS